MVPFRRSFELSNNARMWRRPIALPNKALKLTSGALAELVAPLAA